MASAKALARAREAVMTTRGIATDALSAVGVAFDGSMRRCSFAAAAELSASAKDRVRIRCLAFIVVLLVQLRLMTCILGKVGIGRYGYATNCANRGMNCTSGGRNAAREDERTAIPALGHYTSSANRPGDTHGHKSVPGTPRLNYGRLCAVQGQLERLIAEPGRAVLALASD